MNKIIIHVLTEPGTINLEATEELRALLARLEINDLFIDPHSQAIFLIQCPLKKTATSETKNEGKNAE